MTFDAYAKWFSKRRRGWSARPILYNPNYALLSFLIMLFAALGFTVLCVLAMSWLDLVPLDIRLFEKPFPLLAFVGGGIGAWIGEAVAYHRWGNTSVKVMIGPDQPAEKTT